MSNYVGGVYIYGENYHRLKRMIRRETERASRREQLNKVTWAVACVLCIVAVFLV